MKTPTALRVIAVLIVPVALAWPIIASSFVYPWLKRSLGEDFYPAGAVISLYATWIVLVVAPVLLVLLSIYLHEERKPK